MPPARWFGSSSITRFREAFNGVTCMVLTPEHRKGRALLDREALKRDLVAGAVVSRKLKLPRFRGVELDLGDYGSVVTASIAAS
jgi:hypothetical protein